MLIKAAEPLSSWGLLSRNDQSKLNKFNHSFIVNDSSVYLSPVMQCPVHTRYSVFGPLFPCTIVPHWNVFHLGEQHVILNTTIQGPIELVVDIDPSSCEATKYFKKLTFTRGVNNSPSSSATPSSSFTNVERFSFSDVNMPSTCNFTVYLHTPCTQPECTITTDSPDSPL